VSGSEAHESGSEVDPTFEVLNAYVDSLHQGESLAEPGEVAPQLQSALGCLRALDELAVDLDQSRTDLLRVATPSELLPRRSNGPAARKFGDYELLAEVGRGGMGIVYRARQQSLARDVAVKMILASHLAAPDHVRRFQAEARAAAGVRHPNIVSVYEAGELDGQHYFVMDFVEGESLSERLMRGALEPTEAARLVATIARAVDHLHRNGVVHRDLKPSNILLDQQGRPYVNDFGLAKALGSESDLTKTGIIAGTPAYMAPEQARGQSATVGPRCDIYSLGVILYEVLTGRPPFRESNPLDTILMVLERQPTPPRVLNAQVPRELEWITLKCLEKSPEKRYATAGELADDLERVLRGQAPQARPPSTLERAWRWMRREPALMSHLGVMGCFYAVQLFNYHLIQVIDWDFHYPVSLILLTWLAALFVCQRFIHSPQWGDLARYAWGTVDAGAILALLLWADGAASPLIVALPLVVVGSGLWFRVRLVLYMTFLALLSYAILVADFYFRRSDLQQRFDPAFDRPVYFAITLLALGVVVAFQVRRIRRLSRYYEQHRIS